MRMKVWITSSSSSLVSLVNEYDCRQYLLMHPKVTHKPNSRGTGPSAMVTETEEAEVTDSAVNVSRCLLRRSRFSSCLRRRSRSNVSIPSVTADLHLDRLQERASQEDRLIPQDLRLDFKLSLKHFLCPP